MRIALNVVLAAAGVAAIAALVLEHGGFALSRGQEHLLHISQTVIVVLFVLDRVARLALADDRFHHLRDNWVDFALIAVFFVAALAIGRMHVLSAGALYVAITQIYILVTLVMHVVNVNLQVAGSGIHPTWMLIGSFAAMCLIGSGLLMLPAATPEDSPILYYPEALFTAVSATCVTGLVVRDTGTDFTQFGQVVILVMIQLGGLGIMLFGTVLAMWVGKGLSMRGSDAIGQMMGAEGIGGFARAIKFVVAITFALELAGAATMYPMFAGALDAHGGIMTAGMAVWYSVFHSISSFCNAGFALYGRNMMQGVGQADWASPLRDSWRIMGVMAPLIILGGLGFPVLQDIARRVRNWLGRLRRPLHLTHSRDTAAPGARLSLHSRIVLTTSAVLIVLGAAVLLMVEARPAAASRSAGSGSSETVKTGVIGRNEISRQGNRPVGDWRGMSTGKRIREAVFQSITARTAGFNTIEMAELTNAGKLWMCVLMTVGGSPASTAGGMKTVTIALIILAAWSVLRRRTELEAFHRSISMEVLRRTITLAVLYMMLLLTVTILLCVTMRGHNFVDLLFEASSACGTVGLSTGVTRRLTTPAEFVIMGGMFIGRLGPLTLLLALTSRFRNVRYTFPREDVVIG